MEIFTSTETIWEKSLGLLLINSKKAGGLYLYTTWKEALKE